jgi:phage-related protein
MGEKYMQETFLNLTVITLDMKVTKLYSPGSDIELIKTEVFGLLTSPENRVKFITNRLVLPRL